MLIPDGIWLDLPHEVHVADPALGSTDLKAILLNAVAWHGANRNPVWRAILAEMQSKGQRIKALTGQAFGSCVHTIALEPDKFDLRYFVPPERPPGLPDTKEQIAAALMERNITPPRKSALRIEFEAMARMFKVPLADDWDDEVRLMAGERQIIPEAWRRSLELTKRVIDRHSEARKFMSRGRGEVSIFYTDEHGHRYKGRFDYLRVRTVSDIKTYENRQGNDAVETFAMARDKFLYAMQAVNYMDIRTNILPDLVAKRRIWRGTPITTDDGHIEALPPTADDLKFLDEVAAFTTPTWWWIAVSTLCIPEVDTIRFRPELMAYSSARVQVDQAKMVYREMRERFGDDDTEMWISDRGLIDFADHSFSTRALNKGAPVYDRLLE